MSRNQSRLDRDVGVAVIGMGCHYPGAKKLKDLWQNILSKRQQFRQISRCALAFISILRPQSQNTR